MTSKKIKILVAYYSQTGQLEQILNSILEPLKLNDEISIDYLKIAPVNPYSFPWTSKKFFDEFPECVREISTPIDDNFTLEDDYDLVILGYQPWFLSVSRPMNSFLQINKVKTALAGKNVITVIGCRNMWTQGQEMIKKRLKAMGANLVGNIALRDRAWNLISVYTILRWMLYGKKGNSGVSQEDIQHCKVYGEYIQEQLLNNQPIEQKALVAKGAVEGVGSLTFLEKRAIILFRLFADFILKAKSPEQRQRRLTFFKVYLFIGIVILSPLAFIAANIRSLLFHKKADKEKNYFEGV